MKPAPTLVDHLYRLSFSNKPIAGWKNNAAMREALVGARRFVADAPMAGFMAELANESFLKAGMDSPLNLKIADSLRVSARLPHESVWIEYPLRAYQQRSAEVRHGPPIDPKQVPEREGWLIQQHPQIESAHILHLFTQDSETHEDGFDAWTFPFAFGWCSDDNPLPWRVTLKVPDRGDPRYRRDERYRVPSSYLAGLSHYERDNVNCVRSPLIIDPESEHGKAYEYLLKEWMGILRRVWALLATIENLPLRHGEVRTSKGFLGKGRIRQYLDHTTITLNVPASKDTRVLARRVIAHAHRRRHEVRSFWRNDWRNPPSKHCNPHLWEVMDDNADHIQCSQCLGRQTFIHKHMRGSAEFGLVTHDYRLKHGAGSAA